MQALIFDLDDTLYPERQYVSSGFKAVAEWASARLGIPAPVACRELESLFSQGVRGDTFDCWLRVHGANPEEHTAEMIGMYRGHVPALVPYDDVLPVLAAARTGARLGLLTDGYAECQRRKLDALRLAPFFDATVFSDDLGRDAWKPSPRGFVRALELLGVDPEEATYVADNPMKDFIGARGLGMRTVRIRRRGGLYSSLDSPSVQHAADAEIPALDRLLPLLSGLDGTASARVSRPSAW